MESVKSVDIITWYSVLPGAVKVALCTQVSSKYGNY
jgi:hypothetical protein